MHDIESMKSIDIKGVDKAELIDLNTIHIDQEKPVAERIESFIQQIKNPYCFKVGDIAVKVNYKEDGPTFQQNFEELISVQ